LNKMNNKNLLVYGAVAVGAIFLYSRYAKKGTNAEEPQGGGGGGGVPMGPIGPLPIMPVVIQNIPRGGVVTPTTPTNPVVVSGLGGARPVVTASTSSTGVGNTGTGISNTGGITGAGMGTSTSGAGTTSTTTQGGPIFKPFDGDNGRMRLENLVRSFNRP
jgi:hypothetical protein